MRSLVPKLFARLPRPGTDDGGAGSRRGSFHHCPLGAPIRSGTEQAHPARASAPNRSWRMDETYVRVAGRRTYLYRAFDSTGQTIEFMISPKRATIAPKP